uniref:Uncharacterized protein n=1 Tax=Timema tahoe TaxID=61484 RepID=A0A7R9IF88_9NEOP|nr:unnamed protein product [Timema tahoe]
MVCDDDEDRAVTCLSLLLHDSLHRNTPHLHAGTDNFYQMALLGTRDSDYCHFTTVLEEEAPITGNTDSPALPNLICIRRKTDHGKQKNDNAVSQ